MRIIAFDGDSELEDIPSLAIVIKAVPFEKSFVPAFFIQSPDDEHDMCIDELNALMDGIEIAQRSIDRILAFILKENFKQIDEKYQQKIDEIEDDL
jgi:hypothetical protein